ncbi:hypothetical protein RHECNPAF_122100137 [Rhizobium etli CNPAF512]|nr:hypothetical protein RHECNPAF_122100137 [Rhizobium etli CNPAF512]
MSESSTPEPGESLTVKTYALAAAAAASAARPPPSQWVERGALPVHLTPDRLQAFAGSDPVKAVERGEAYLRGLTLVFSLFK